MITLTREEVKQALTALQESWRTDLGDIAIKTLRARLGAPEPERPLKLGDMEQRAFDQECGFLSATQPEPDYRDVVIKGDLWRIEFLPDHAASVVLVKANYEAQSEPKLVAYLRRKEFAFGYEQVDREDHGAIPVYTAPPQREWQGLTDEEYEAMAETYVTNCYFDTLKYAKAIEAKLKEKNASHL